MDESELKASIRAQFAGFKENKVHRISLPSEQFHKNLEAYIHANAEESKGFGAMYNEEEDTYYITNWPYEFPAPTAEELLALPEEVLDDCDKKNHKCECEKFEKDWMYKHIEALIEKKIKEFI